MGWQLCQGFDKPHSQSFVLMSSTEAPMSISSGTHLCPDKASSIATAPVLETFLCHLKEFIYAEVAHHPLAAIYSWETARTFACKPLPSHWGGSFCSFAFSPQNCIDANIHHLHQAKCTNGLRSVVARPPPQNFQLFTQGMPLCLTYGLFSRHMHSAVVDGALQQLTNVYHLPGHVEPLCNHCILSCCLAASNLCLTVPIVCYTMPVVLHTWKLQPDHLHAQIAALWLIGACHCLKTVHFCQYIVAHCDNLHTPRSPPE